MQQEKSCREPALLAAYNDKTGRFGLTFTQKEEAELVACRNESLRVHGRVEFGAGILEKLILAFGDSRYIQQGENAGQASVPDSYPDG